jgi:hypothetical protein
MSSITFFGSELAGIDSSPIIRISELEDTGGFFNPSMISDGLYGTPST